MVTGVALDFGQDGRIRLMDVGDRPFDARQLFVVAPALVCVSLGEEGKLGSAFRMGPLEDCEAGLVRDEGRDRNRRGGRVELERLTGLDLGGVEAVEGPVTASDRVLLVGHRLAHVDAMGDARAVGNDQRRARPGVGLE